MPSVAGRGHGRGRRTINEINMVPFIDVMLVLLIIFMVTAPLISPSVIDVPSVGKASAQPEQVIQVLIDAQEKIELKSTGSTSAQISVNLSSLPQQVMQLQGGQKSHHMVGGFSVFGGGRHTDFELRAFGFADGIFAGGGFSQNVDDKHIALPRKKGVAGTVARSLGGGAFGHALIIRPCPPVSSCLP